MDYPAIDPDDARLSYASWNDLPPDRPWCVWHPGRGLVVCWGQVQASASEEVTRLLRDMLYPWAEVRHGDGRDIQRAR
jgi:hypothetical protein